MKNLTFKEWFIGTTTTLMLGLVGWTVLNTHLLIVQMTGDRVGNEKDHTSMVSSICENKDNIIRNSADIIKNSTRLTRLEAIKEDDYYDLSRKHTDNSANKY